MEFTVDAGLKDKRPDKKTEPAPSPSTKSDKVGKGNA